MDEAWKDLGPVERLYLESEFASEELNQILDMHAVVEERVFWSDSFDSTLTCKNILFYSSKLSLITVYQ